MRVDVWISGHEAVRKIKDETVLALRLHVLSCFGVHVLCISTLTTPRLNCNSHGALLGESASAVAAPM